MKQCYDSKRCLKVITQSDEVIKWWNEAMSQSVCTRLWQTVKKQSDEKMWRHKMMTQVDNWKYKVMTQSENTKWWHKVITQSDDIK